MDPPNSSAKRGAPWNKGRLTGQKAPLRLKDVWAIRVCHGNQVASRAIVMQRKAQRPLHFEISAETRTAIERWITEEELRPDDFLFPSRPRSEADTGRIPCAGRRPR